MTRALSAAALPAVTGIEDDGSFVQMLEITLADATVIRLVRAKADVTWEGNPYTRFPFALDALQQDAKGSPVSLSVRVSNVSRAIQGYLELGGGGIGATCRLIVTHSDNLGTTTADVDETFTCIACRADAQWVRFGLGAKNVARQAFPQDKFYTDHCRWIGKPAPDGGFKGTWCGYAGSETTCSGKFDRCRQLGNSTRFGGFPGMVGQGVYSIS